MSRSFAILLILLGSTIIASFIWLHFQLLERQHEGLFADGSNVVKTSIEQKMKGMDFTLYSLEASLEERWLFERYTELIDVFEKAKVTRKALASSVLLQHEVGEERTGQKQTPRQLQKACEKELTSLQAAINLLIESKGEIFDLSERQQTELLADINAVTLQSLPPTISQNVVHQQRLAAYLTVLSFLNAQEAVLTKLIQVTGSKAFIIDTYYPVVIGSPQYPKVGELHTAQVSVLGNLEKLVRADILLIVGKDTLTPGPDGTALYELTPKSRGLHSIPTQCIITNPLTGQTMIGDGKYEFNVY